MDRLAQIFERQAAYLKSLRPIYRQNGFLLHAGQWPLSFQGRHEQEEFRLLAWRFTEELVEAEEAYECGTPRCDYHEEMADALHFLVELCLATGITHTVLVTGVEDLVPAFPKSGMDSLDYVFDRINADEIHSPPFFNAIRALSLAMMNLRQRPWRTDNRSSDFPRFALMMQATFYSFINNCVRTGITAEDLTRAYFLKGKINDERTAQQNCEHGIPRKFCTGVHND